MNSSVASRPHLLVAIPQSPFDPSSGAARTARSTAEVAATLGLNVRVVATTATEARSAEEPVDLVRRSGVTTIDVVPPRGGKFRQLHFSYRGVRYTLLDTGRSSFVEWEQVYGRQFDTLVDSELESRVPDLFLTYGGSPGDLRRQARARRIGSRTAFMVANLGYLRTGFLEHFDDVIFPSRFLAERYRTMLRLDPVVLYNVIQPEDAISDQIDPIFVTVINPSVEKGLFFIARLAEEIGTNFPRIAMLVVEARGTAGMLVSAGAAGGFDLRRHENVLLAGQVAKPREIYRNTRLLLVPSVVEEAAGRVVQEALLNGIPPLVSDRGGLPEMCNGGGFVLPLSPELTMEVRQPVASIEVRPWLELIERLCADERFYESASQAARAAGARWTRESLLPLYRDYFDRAISG